MNRSPIYPCDASVYGRDGFAISPMPLLPAERVEDCRRAALRVVAGEYRTGVPPQRFDDLTDPRPRLRKIDNAHLSDDALFAALVDPAIGRFAAELTGASFVQLWCVQLLVKPPGAGAGGNVGWHQDFDYWHVYWQPQSELFTLWFALAEVGVDDGPVRFVRGSHRRGFLRRGDFFGADLEALRARFGDGDAWDEVPAILPAGGATLHDKLTIHGSGPNVGVRTRISLALHLRSERSWPVPGATQDHVTRLDDRRRCPVLYDARRNGG